MINVSIVGVIGSWHSTVQLCLDLIASHVCLWWSIAKCGPSPTNGNHQSLCYLIAAYPPTCGRDTILPISHYQSPMAYRVWWYGTEELNMWLVNSSGTTSSSLLWGVAGQWISMVILYSTFICWLFSSTAVYFELLVACCWLQLLLEPLLQHSLYICYMKCIGNCCLDSGMWKVVWFLVADRFIGGRFPCMVQLCFFIHLHSIVD